MTTLAEAQGWLRERLDQGASCPCCTQFAKVYRRKVHATMAAELIRVWHAHRDQWFHLPTAVPAGRGGDFSKLAFWELVEEDGATRDDGSPRTGWHRVTAAGELYVRGDLLIPKYARVYDGRCLGFAGPEVGVRDALGKRFRYDELMAGM